MPSRKKTNLSQISRNAKRVRLLRLQKKSIERGLSSDGEQHVNSGKSEESVSTQPETSISQVVDPKDTTRYPVITNNYVFLILIFLNILNKNISNCLIKSPIR